MLLGGPHALKLPMLIKLLIEMETADSGRTFEIPAGRSENEHVKIELRPKSGLPEFLVEAEFMF